VPTSAPRLTVPCVSVLTTVELDADDGAAEREHPTVVLRRRLAESRRAGATFDVSWPVAVSEAIERLDGVERVEWSETLSAHEEIWRSAYERRLRAGRPLSADLLADSV
jgi:hypothetical protein